MPIELLRNLIGSYVPWQCFAGVSRCLQGQGLRLAGRQAHLHAQGLIVRGSSCCRWRGRGTINKSSNSCSPCSLQSPASDSQSLLKSAAVYRPPLSSSSAVGGTRKCGLLPWGRWGSAAAVFYFFSIFFFVFFFFDEHSSTCIPLLVGWTARVILLPSVIYFMEDNCAFCRL